MLTNCPTYWLVEGRITLAELDGLVHAALLHAGGEGVGVREVVQLHLVAEDALPLADRQLAGIVRGVGVLLGDPHLHQLALRPVDLGIEVRPKVLLVRENKDLEKRIHGRATRGGPSELTLPLRCCWEQRRGPTSCPFRRDRGELLSSHWKREIS